MNSYAFTDSYADSCNPVDQYIEMAETFAAMSYQGVYLINLDSNKFIFSSEYSLLRCGFSAEEMKSQGFEFLIKQVFEEDRKLLGNIGEAVRGSYAEMPFEFKKQMTLFLNLHIYSMGSLVMVCHKLRLLGFDPEGNPHYLLGLVSPSVHDGEAVFLASISGTDYEFRFNPESKKWVPLTRVHLSPDELTMLRLTMQGHSLEQIGALMYKSPDTIKFYRRQVFIKLNVKNISEAIAYATHYCLI